MIDLENYQEYKDTVYNKLAQIINYCKGLYNFYWPVSSAVEVHHKYYTINYYHGFRYYKIRTPRVRGPCKFDKVFDQCDNDVTEKIKQYAGPSHNFHGIPTTPGMLGYSSLKFDELVFKSDDIIIFK